MSPSKTLEGTKPEGLWDDLVHPNNPPLALPTTGSVLAQWLPVCIVIPCYNEALRLPDTLVTLITYLYQHHIPASHCTILVVDDGSSDATVSVAQHLQAQYPSINLQLVSHPYNKGKGSALQTGILAAQHPFVLLFDADSATPIDQFASFCQAVHAIASPQQRHNTLWIGSRTHPQTHLNALASRRLAGRVFHWLICLLFGWGHRITDTQCGFKLLPVTLAKTLATSVNATGYCWDVELIDRALALGATVTSLPVRWKHQAHSKVNLWVSPWQMAWGLLQIKARSLAKKQ
jgi:dolichyl-phosphate beta-glucosyltransferase